MVKYLTIVLLMLLPGIMTASAGDPTRPQLGGAPSFTSDSSQSRLVLSAIFSKGKQRSAIINGKLYRRGDRVAGHRILAIKEREVILANNENRTKLVLIKKIKN